MFEGMHYIYEVYREMNFSRAAKNLYISQPSLSAAVKKEEAKAGFPIFDRSTTPVQLTDFGREYIKAAQIIMDVKKGVENYINDTNELKSGSLSIGGTNLFASYILPPLLMRFTEKYPSVNVNLVEASTAELADRLFSGRLDLIIDNNFMDSSVYEKKFFCKEHLLLTVPDTFLSNMQAKKYQLKSDDIKKSLHLDPAFPCVPPEIFMDDPFLFLKSGNDTRSRADKICHSSGFIPHIKLKLDQQITAYNLSCYGMGISFTGDILINHVADNRHMIYYKLDNHYAARDVNFFYKRNRYMTRTVEEFLKLEDLGR